MILVAYQRGRCELFSLDVERKLFASIEVINTGQMIRSIKEITPGIIITMDRLGNIGGYTLYSKQLISLGGLGIGDVCRRLVGSENNMVACGIAGSIIQLTLHETPQQDELKHLQEKCLIVTMGRKLYGDEIILKHDNTSQNIALKNIMRVDLFRMFKRLPIEVQKEIINAYSVAYERKDAWSIISEFLKAID